MKVGTVGNNVCFRLIWCHVTRDDLKEGLLNEFVVTVSGLNDLAQHHTIEDH